LIGTPISEMKKERRMKLDLGVNNETRERERKQITKERAPHHNMYKRSKREPNEYEQ
jgi:hypothetical protein